MRIATWNLERPKNASSPRSLRLIDKLSEIGADIWILTETHDSMTPGMNYHSVSSTTITKPPISHNDGEHKTAVWSRWPILETYESSTQYRSVGALTETPLGSLVIYGAVLPYHAAKWPYGTPRQWDAQYAAIATQGADWARLRRTYPSAGFCLAGDFNQNRPVRVNYGTKWGRALLDLALKENKLIGVTQIDFPSVETLDKKEKELLTHSIDHICLDTHWAGKVKKVGIWPGQSTAGEYLSDHSGVFVDLAVDN